MKFFNVADEFEKNSELKEEDLTHLKEWLSKQPHLPQVTGKYQLLYYFCIGTHYFVVYYLFDSIPSYVKLSYL